MEYKDFNWDTYRGITNPLRFAWMEQNHAKPISEEQYVAEMKLLKQFSKENKKGKKARKLFHCHYTPGALKKNYRNLKTRFGFFQ